MTSGVAAPTPAVRKRRRRWLRIAIPLALIVLFYAAVGYWASSLMIGDNPRWHGMNRGPADFGLAAETLSFPATDGVPIRAWWIPARTAPRGTVIIAPGGDHTRQVMLPRAVFLARAGYNVLDIDLRGHGESGGRYISPGLVERQDVLGAIAYVRLRGERGPVALMGVCLGGVASIFTAAESAEVQAVVADSAFPSGRRVFAAIRDYIVGARSSERGRVGVANSHGFWVRAAFRALYLPGLLESTLVAYYLRTGVWLGLDFVAVVPAAERVQCPAMVISGGADWIVPPADARTLFAAFANQRKLFLSIAGASHDGTYKTAPETYERAVLGFLSANLSP